MGVLIEDSDRELLHVGKEVIPDRLHGALGHVDHDPCLHERGKAAEPVPEGDAANGAGERSKVGSCLEPQRLNVGIDEGFCE